MGKPSVTNVLPGVLRISAEPYQYFSDAEVHALLTADPRGYFNFIRDAMVEIAGGRAHLTLPPKQVFTDHVTGGDFRVMPCELRVGASVMKTVKLVGTNTLQRRVPDQITVGKLFVVDRDENFVSAILEACILSSARTGVCAALAVSCLARGCERMVVVGSGRVGYYAALYAVAAAGVAHVTFCDLDADRARETAALLAATCPGVKTDAQPFDALAKFDIVVLATTSARPVASPPGWGANLVVSLGADTDSQSELDPAWCGRAQLFCDTPDSLRFGDLRTWMEAGRINADSVPDLLDVLRKPARATKQPRIFISTGSALFDNLTASYVLERAAGKPQRS